MQDEEIDIKIKEAANQHHPPYDDRAWAKMELLLNKHLPLKKDRRRWFFFLLLFLLLDAAILLLVVKPWKNNSATVIENKKTIIQPAAPLTNAENTSSPIDQTVINPGQTDPSNTLTSAQPVTNNNNTTITNTATITGNKDLQPIANKQQTVIRKKGKTTTAVTDPGTAMDVNNDADGANKNLTNSKIGDLTKTVIDEKLNQPVIKSEPAKSKVIPTVEKLKDSAITSPAKNNKKTKRGLGSNFAITLSAGADMSYVSLKNPGKITLLYGAGLSYTFAKRFTVRTGFYVSRKIYSATPAQYNNTIYPNLTNIDANCLIYQIPVSIGYNFWARKKHNWFGNVGLTSLLMKKEVYDYEYKPVTGQPYYYKRTVDDKNQHYFSVLSLSAGYNYTLNKRFSISAEAFVNLPLSGIGFGKIKLNSAGILLSLSVKPFIKKK